MMLSKRLKSLRNEADLTQKEFALKFNMSDARYNQYETGKRAPDYETLQMFADYFNVSVDYLLGRTDIRNPYNSKNAAHPEGENLDKFRKRLKEERLKKKLTQVQLAEILDIDRTSISKYENGKQLPELYVLNSIADFFGVSLDYITGRSNNRTSNTEEVVSSDFLKKLDDLSEESKKELEKYIQLLKMKDQLDKSKDEQSSALEKEA